MPNPIENAMAPKQVKLRIKLPRNIQVVTEIVPTAATLPLNPGSRGPGSLAAVPAEIPTLTMDLTTLKTSQWVNQRLVGGKRLAGGDCECTGPCCVRG
jgi:hypothetical protein